MKAKAYHNSLPKQHIQFLQTNALREILQGNPIKFPNFGFDSCVTSDLVQ
jgi:hypothetical protein